MVMKLLVKLLVMLLVMCEVCEGQNFVMRRFRRVVRPNKKQAARKSVAIRSVEEGGEREIRSTGEERVPVNEMKADMEFPYKAWEKNDAPGEGINYIGTDMARVRRDAGDEDTKDRVDESQSFDLANMGKRQVGMVVDGDMTGANATEGEEDMVVSEPGDVGETEELDLEERQFLSSYHGAQEPEELEELEEPDEPEETKTVSKRQMFTNMNRWKGNNRNGWKDEKREPTGRINRDAMLPPPSAAEVRNAVDKLVKSLHMINLTRGKRMGDEPIGAKQVEDEAQKELQAKAERLLKEKIEKHFHNIEDARQLDYDVIAQHIADDMVNVDEYNIEEWAEERGIDEDVQALLDSGELGEDVDGEAVKGAIERLLELMNDKKTLLTKIHSLFTAKELE